MQKTTFEVTTPSTLLAFGLDRAAIERHIAEVEFLRTSR